jgi:PAS domain S-box-containing protein
VKCKDVPLPTLTTTTDSKQSEFPLGEVSPEDTRMELACGATKMVLLYLEDVHGSSVADEVARSTRMNRSYIANSRNWVSMDYYYRFLQRMVELTGDPKAPFDAGTYAVRPECFGAMATLVIRLGAVRGTYALYARLTHLFCRVARWEHVSTGPTSCRLTVRYPEHKQDRNNCLAVQGAIAALSELHGCPRASIRHTECACDGHPACVYELSWIEKPAHNRALTGALAGLCGGFAFATYLHWNAWSPLLGYTMGLIGYLGGRIFDYSTRLRESHAYNKAQSASLEVSMEATEKLNEELQGQVEERTEALRVANQDLKKAYADLQESQDRELAQQRTATIGSLASGMAHELNTPLNTIQMAMQGLRQSGSLEQHELLGNAWKAALRCSRIVRELLAFSREPQTVSLMRLHEVLDGTLSVFENEMPNGITIIREFDDPPPIAHVDGAQIQQSLLNMLNNAVDAMAQSGKITVRLRSEDDQAVVEIADNGPGIPSDLQKKIFEPFESTKRRTGLGLGLGLSISAELVKKNGGQINLASRPGEGACFAIRFPLVAPGQESAIIGRGQITVPGRPALEGWVDAEDSALTEASPVVGRTKPEFTGATMRILLVEDDPGAGLTLKRLMEQHDIHVTHVTSGGDGIEAFEPDQFDAVVTDVMLGDMTGVDVLRSIRDRDDCFPVILLTGHDSIGSAIEALRLGAQDYIQKPLERIEDLITPVRKAVKHHKLQVASRKLTDELRASETRFRSFAELLPETVFEADREARVIFLNQSGMEQFGLTEAILRDGFYLPQGVPPEEGERAMAILGRVVDGETVSGAEFTGMHQSGRTFPVLTFSTPIRRDGAVVGIRAIVVDVTQQKETEKELLHFQELLREMDSELQVTEERERCTLASDLHDSVAQLLFAARMRMSIARQHSTDPKMSTHLDAANEILTTAVEQTRSLVFQLSPPSLYTEGLQAALEDLAGHMLPMHGMRVAFTPSETALQCDEKTNIHVFRAVRELLINVAKHAAVSECSVSVTRPDGQICVTVEDKGAGFDAATVERGPTHGGFGLFGIRERLKTIDGNLTIESEPGAGTRATVSAPVAVTMAP